MRSNAKSPSWTHLFILGLYAVGNAFAKTTEPQPPIMGFTKVIDDQRNLCFENNLNGIHTTGGWKYFTKFQEQGSNNIIELNIADYFVKIGCMSDQDPNLTQEKLNECHKSPETVQYFPKAEQEASCSVPSDPITLFAPIPQDKVEEECAEVFKHFR